MSHATKLQLEIVSALGRVGLPDRGREPLHETLRDLGHRAAKTPGAIPELLRVAAALEAMGRLTTLATARRINDLMGSDDGRAALATAVQPELDHHPDSMLLLYVRAVTLAKGGEIEAAHEIVGAAMAKRRATHAGLAPDAAVDNKRVFDQLTRLWRVVDMIARDDVAWSAAGSPDDDEAADAGSAGIEEPVSGQQDETGGARNQGLQFSEDLIQNRRQEAYLAACVRNFRAAGSAIQRAAALKSMIRQGLRRLPDYSAAYELARQHYREMRPEWQDLLSAPFEDGGMQQLRLLRSILPIAIALGERTDIAAIQQALLRLLTTPGAEACFWHAARTLASTDPDAFGETTAKIVLGSGRRPEKKQDIESFFAWACEARQYEAAHELFRELPPRIARGKAVQHYVRILLRCGRHEDARLISHDINATNLSDPRRMDPYLAWMLIQRDAEMAFCIDTAKWFSSVPQPRSPKGVVFILPRDINQLRRYPLVALMELKRKGWAVVSLVEGLLPAEPTGVDDIDRFIGCVTWRPDLTPAARSALEPIQGFESDVATGSLRWNGLDLSHQLWEEAAVGRRRFSVSFSCPALQTTLQRIVDWAEMTAIVLQNARLTAERTGLRMGFMTLSQSRLPDALPRFYCEAFGDPETFFCLHATNGYENYFRNFASPISSRMTVRNMTAHPELRTASFPVLAELEAWRMARRSEQDAMVAKVNNVSSVNRSAQAAEKSAEAQACLARIQAWRSGGGKVACAFGKIVCDLAVPRDGGPAHRDMKDWLNHTIESVRGSNTLLLIKPHPHELRNEIATFLTEQFEDLIETELPDNVVVLGHRWFNIGEIAEVVDLGLLYNGTTAIEFGTLGKPVVLCSHFGSIDYPVGHPIPRDRAHYRRMTRFEEPAIADPELRERSAAWLHFVGGDERTAHYRYHARSVTNRRVYPPWWFTADIESYLERGDPNVSRLVREIIGTEQEP